MSRGIIRSWSPQHTGVALRAPNVASALRAREMEK